MNDKLRQLAEQASHQSPDGYPVTIPYSKDFAERFAELIVRECATLAFDGPNGILEHFGVEE